MTPAEALAKKMAGKRKPVPSRYRLIVNTLRAMRTALGLRQTEVAAAIGIGVAQYNKMENGMTPALFNAIRIARFFGQPIESIWTERTDDP